MNEGVFIIGTTDRPQELEANVRKKLAGKKIYVGPPDAT